MRKLTDHRWCPSDGWVGASTEAGFRTAGPVCTQASGWQPAKNIAYVSLDFHLSPTALKKRDIDQPMCFVKMQDCPDKVTDMFGLWLMLLTLGFWFLVACGLASIAYHPGMTLNDTVDSKGPTACQNHVPGKEMERKQRGTTSGIRKLDRCSHLLLLPPSSWAAVITGLFLQVHICGVFALHLSFCIHVEALEAVQEPFGSVE